MKTIKMSFEHLPISTLRKRAVYKTEFDIFKRSTDIDLLSLISYNEGDDQEKVGKRKSDTERPKSYPTDQRNRIAPKSARIVQSTRLSERRQVSKSANHLSKYHRIDSAYKIRNARSKCETEIYKDFAKASRTFLRTKSAASRDARPCKSALDIRTSGSARENESVRCQTTCGFHPSAKSRITSCFNTDKPKANIKHTESKPKSAVNRNLVTSGNEVWHSRVESRLTTTKQTKQTTHRTTPNKTIQDVRADTNKPTGNNSDVLIDSNVSGSCHDNKLVEKVTTGNDKGLSNPEDVYVNECEDRNCQESAETKLQGFVLQCEKTDCDVVNKFDDCDAVNKSEESETYGRYTDQRLSETDDVCVVDNISVQEHESKEECYDSRDSGIESHGLTPDFHIKLDEASNESEEEEIDERHVKFNDDATELLIVPDNTEDLQIDSVSDIDVPLSEVNSEEGSVADEAEEYDVNDLINDLERFGNQSRLSTLSAGAQSQGGLEDVNSLFDETINEKEEPETETDHVDGCQDNEDPVTLTFDDFTMSREARHAILETLNDMGVKRNGRNKENIVDDIRYKPVCGQKKIRENRSKYDHYVRERTRSVLRNQFKSLDSLGNDDNSSRYSSPLNGINGENCSVDEGGQLTKFPSIAESGKKVTNKATKKHNSKTKVYTLEQAKKKKYKIPGIGNYNMVASPESDFEITPPGFDSRYNPRPVISKDEMEIPPRFIRERSIQKCKKWLDKVHLSPMSLKPAARHEK